MGLSISQFDQFQKGLLGWRPKAFFPISFSIYGPSIAIPPRPNRYLLVMHNAIPPSPAKVRRTFIAGQLSEHEANSKKTYIRNGAVPES